MRRLSLLAVPLGIALLASCSDGPRPTEPTPADPSGASRALLAEADHSLVLAGVELRPGTAVDLHARVFVDESRLPAACPASHTALALHGFAHTAATWEPFAEAIFAERTPDVCRLIALDLPGHGGSGEPSAGLPFGFLFLDDYATAVTGALAALEGRGLAPRVLIGHSQGGIVLQMVQQRLVAAGSSLRGAHDVKEVVLLAPAIPAALPWAAATPVDGQPSPLAQLLGAFGVPEGADPPSHFEIPDAVWPFLFFTSSEGLVPTAPLPEDVAARGYNAPEPLFSALQLVGAGGLARPTVDRGVFARRHGSRLAVVAFEQDGLIRPGEVEALFEHLTDGGNGGEFRVVTGSRSVHDMYVSDPAALLAGAGGVLR